MRNKKYFSSWIVNWLDGHRETWDDFYDSERWGFTQIKKIVKDEKIVGSILDAGCGTGGLYRAFRENIHISTNVGVDINPKAIELAKKLSTSTGHCEFLCADILDLSLPSIARSILWSH